MNNVVIICKYCGFEEIKVVYNKNSLVDQKCGKCGDTDLILKNAGNKIDQYEGCPPFPEKGTKELENDDITGWPHIWGGD